MGKSLSNPEAKALIRTFQNREDATRSQQKAGHCLSTVYVAVSDMKQKWLSAP